RCSVDPRPPALRRATGPPVEAGRRAGRWVGICGEMAGDPRTAVLLVGLGVDELSMSCYDLPRVTAALRSVRHDEPADVALRSLELSSAGAVKELVRQRLEMRLPSFLLAKRS